MSKEKKHTPLPESLYERITTARQILGIPEDATMETIKNAFREKILLWHPDKCREPSEDCRRKATELIDSYKLIVDFCNHYQYSFSRQTIEAHAPYEEIWFRLYGHDPMWGPPE